MAYSLLKTIAHNSFADGIYKEILTRSTRFYYFIGRTLSWANEYDPQQVIDSHAYERDVRNEIIAMKEISPSDISYVIPRKDWISGTVYDAYDDQYSSEIQGLNLVSGGTVYAAAPIITIGNIVPVSSSVTAGQQYYYNGYLYTVKTTGTTGASNAVLLNYIGTTYTHGGVTLTCVGVQATATCTIGTSGVNNQKVISTTMVNKGSGYTTVPNVYFNTGTASATAIITNAIGGIQQLDNANYYVMYTNNIYICVDNNGGAMSTVAPTGTISGFTTTADGYIWKYMSTIPTNSKFLTTFFMPVYTATQYQYSANGSIVNVFVDNPGAGYLSSNTQLPLSTAVTLNDVYYYNGYVYTVTVAGNTASSYTGIGNVIGATYVSGTASIICNGISTTITIVGDGTGASLTPLITNGKLSGVQINNAGSGYTYMNLNVSGEGASASLSASLYTGTSPYSNQSQIEVSTISGAICSIPVISQGYNYTTNVTVAISGDGTGATATATVINSRIVKINITNRGTGYRWAAISFTDISGAGASARAVMSPYGGLGKDPINQLCAKSLMFYSRVSENTNHGVAVTNDYRQIGIIKDPLRYSDSTYLSSNYATSCWLVTASTLIPGGITADDIITVNANSTTYRFRVVSISGSDILLIPLDNGIPDTGMQFVKSVGVYFNVSSVTPPVVDKYSGDLLFIDNESSFVANSSSPAILRTVINF